ncbi:hypothetical protein CN311_25105 [Mesorhizobium sanjuanii]|uniref:Uncharacterized protein n=1 Tax=Mesorhizobium sanjuanii TaxID=2037900 RepID=A0A2A6F9S4_9HYPH|nr:hypothetical protein [Mesorhizobium sanjuanii]PDQ18381.1 hypothetical protein CN311_25105 [Mesorhizobium sanjuanii]
MNDKAMTAYRGILVEIKYRVEAIDAILEGQLPLRGRIAEELCYLQLRMICELIAIGCLIIHGNLSAKKADLLKSYKADWILRVLSEMHPKFFPTPLEPKDSDGSPPAWIHKTDGFMRKGELIEFYNKHAGAKLHRGSARNILKSDGPLDFPSIKRWRDKIVGLLNRHIITSPDEENICYFIMNDGNDNVHSALFQHVR